MNNAFFQTESRMIGHFNVLMRRMFQRGNEVKISFPDDIYKAMIMISFLSSSEKTETIT